jgi:hypothetical protein
VYGQDKGLNVDMAAASNSVAFQQEEKNAIECGKSSSTFYG